MAADFDDGFRFIRTGSEEEALRCWIESAENDSDMQLFLGDYFYFAKSDFERAVFWWRKAAQNGCEEADIKLSEYPVKMIV